MGEHKVHCDIGVTACKAMGATYLWYAPGHIGSKRCCHCEADCDHTLEQQPEAHADWPDCQLYYIREDLMINQGGHGNEYTFAPTLKPVAIDAATSTTVASSPPPQLASPRSSERDQNVASKLENSHTP